MPKFEFDKTVRNESIKINSDNKDILFINGYLEYIYKESEKGKVPLIIAGAGTSSSKVRKFKTDKPIMDKDGNMPGLPTLIEMIKKLHKLIILNEGNELTNLKEIFSDFNNSGDPPGHIDRDWLSKVFTAFENTESMTVKEIWKNFCNWFLFECIEENSEEHFGALNTVTSEAANKISYFSKESNAICLSANFDNYLAYNFDKSGENKILPGMSIFSKSAAEQYLKRVWRDSNKKELSSNTCIFHTNGDVFWLRCTGDETDGYCPKKNLYLPAFSWFNLGMRNDHKITEKDLICDICNSSLYATMTMPGTYKKDHDTREILSMLWKYISSKISTVITVGLSCNWDDVLLKFITSLLFENKIPHLDININSYDKSNKPKENFNKIEIHEKIVYDNYFSSVSLNCDADIGMGKINNQYMKIKESLNKNKLQNFDKNKQNELFRLIEGLNFIKRLNNVRQIGLKGFWKYTDREKTNFSINPIISRWEHSKKVAETALDYYDKIQKENPKESERVLVYISGLLHDCGHLPFSHLLEEVFSELSWKFEYNEEPFRHDHYTSYLIKDIFESDISDTSVEDNKIKGKIIKFINDYNVDYCDIIKVIEGNYGIGYIDALINSEIDSDKIAYLFGDSDVTNTQLMLNPTEFIDKLTKNACITQEKLIALDSESAWIAFRLLNERKRLYKELYFARDLRFFESAVKFILTLYFVQRYNELDRNKYSDFINDKFGDLSHCRIKMVIEDFFDIIDNKEFKCPSLNDSISEQANEALYLCMKICNQPLIPPLTKENKETNNDLDQKKPKELEILEKIYNRLTGVDFEISKIKGKMEHSDFLPYVDEDIDTLSKKLTLKQLQNIRKRIHLKFPGILLIDVYESTGYLSTAKTRRRHLRIDGTDENQVVYLVPSGDRNAWINSNAKASIDISEYVKENNFNITERCFNVYKLSLDSQKIEHALNMLKKEMKLYCENEKEDEDE